MTTTSSKTVITHMKEVFSRQGTPCKLVPRLRQRIGLQTHNVEVHTTPQSNGLAESTVKIVKNLIRKCQHSGQDVYRALQVYRSSPLECGKSPAELLYNRRLRSNLPMLDALLDHQPLDPQFVRRKEGQTEKRKEYYDKFARDLPELKTDDHVRLQDMRTNQWSQSGVIRKKLPNRSYLVEIANGEIRRRNRRHLRPAPRRDDRIQQSSQMDSDLDDNADDGERTPRQPANPAQPASSFRTTSSGRISKPHHDEMTESSNHRRWTAIWTTTQMTAKERRGSQPIQRSQRHRSGPPAVDA